MIRFSASLVVVGIGLLVAGSVTSRLPLIYIAIGVSAVALLFLIIGAIVNRAELLGREPESAVGGQTERGQTERDEYAGELDQAPEPATTAVGASAGATVGSGRSYAGERAADPGYGAAPTPPDRPRETSFPDQLVYRDSGDAEPTRGASRYERFAGDGERGRPNEPQPRPQRPFTEPEPTRMDLSAAAVREAGRQQERERSERGQQERSQPQRSRPEQAQPFVDPQPTRMDWAGGLREAERQELARQDQERRARERPERDKRGGDRADQPFVDPEPTRMDWAADFREHDQRGGTAAPGRPSGERETAHTGQVAPTRPTPIQQPAPTAACADPAHGPPGQAARRPAGQRRARQRPARQPPARQQEPAGGPRGPGEASGPRAARRAGATPGPRAAPRAGAAPAAGAGPRASEARGRRSGSAAGRPQRQARGRPVQRQRCRGHRAPSGTGHDRPERHRPLHPGQRDPGRGSPGTRDGRPSGRPGHGHRRSGQLRIRTGSDGGRRTRSGRDRGSRRAPLPPQRLHPDPVHGRGRPAADAGRTGQGSGLHPVPGLPARRRRGRLSAGAGHRPTPHEARRRPPESQLKNKRARTARGPAPVSGRPPAPGRRSVYALPSQKFRPSPESRCSCTPAPASAGGWPSW